MEFMHIQKDPMQGPDPNVYALWQRFHAKDEQTAIRQTKQFAHTRSVSCVVGLLSLADEDVRVICGWRKGESGIMADLEQREVQREFRAMKHMYERYRSRSGALDARRKQTEEINACAPLQDY